MLFRRPPEQDSPIASDLSKFTECTTAHLQPVEVQDRAHSVITCMWVLLLMTREQRPPETDLIHPWNFLADHLSNICYAS